MNVGAAVIVTGMLVETPNAKQPFEIQASKVELEGASTPDYPTAEKASQLLNIFVPFRICVRVQIRSRQCSVYAP